MTYFKIVRKVNGKKQTDWYKSEKYVGKKIWINKHSGNVYLTCPIHLKSDTAHYSQHSTFCYRRTPESVEQKALIVK